MIKVKEETRHRVALILANVGWWGSFGWICALTVVNLTHPPTAVPTAFQRVSGLFIIFLMGVGIAAGLALSRMRLAKTIVAAFEQGYKLTRPEKKDNNS